MPIVVPLSVRILGPELVVCGQQTGMLWSGMSLLGIGVAPRMMRDGIRGSTRPWDPTTPAIVRRLDDFGRIPRQLAIQPAGPSIAGTRTGARTWWESGRFAHPDQADVLGQVGETCGPSVVEIALARRAIKLTPEARLAFQKEAREMLEAFSREGITRPDVAKLLRSQGVNTAEDFQRMTFSQLQDALKTSDGAVVSLFRDGKSHFVFVEKVLSPAEASKLGLPKINGSFIQVVDPNEGARIIVTSESLERLMRPYSATDRGFVLPLTAK